MQASADKQKTLEIGAELFIGNLDPMVDEKTLYDTFSRFGSLISAPKIARDPENGLSKGYGFVSYSNFEASDDAIANMNGQYLMNKDVSVQYAYKKDGKGERHGDPAERMLAAQAKQNNVQVERPALPPGLLMNGIPAVPAVMSIPPQTNVPPSGMSMRGPPPGMPDGFGAQNYQSVPPPRQNAPLPPPPSGLPQRPPPSQAGYGGPQDFHPPGFATPPQGFPPQLPPGFGPPPGVAPPGLPPGFMPPPGFAPPVSGVPPGYGRR